MGGGLGENRQKIGRENSLKNKRKIGKKVAPRNGWKVDKKWMK